MVRVLSRCQRDWYCSHSGAYPRPKNQHG